MKKKKKPEEKPGSLYGPEFFKQFKTKEALAYWLAIPTKRREPKMQKDLAKILGVSEERLCQIKKEKDFSDIVMVCRKEYFKSFTSDVVEGCLEKAVEGDPRNQKLFLQYIEDFKEATRQEKEINERITHVFAVLGEEKMGELRSLIAQQTLLNAKKREKNGGYIEAEIIEKDDEEIQ